MSAKDPIEELFRDNQHGFDEKPRNLVWDRIDEKLDEKSIVSKKNNWWKYGMAASLIVGFSFAAFLFLNDSNSASEQKKEVQIVLQPQEISEENASEMLDQLEEQNQTVVTIQKNKSAPKIYNEEEMIPMPKFAPQAEMYDMAPAASMAYEPAPAMKEYEAKADEKISYENEKLEDASIVFRGETPEKKGKNYITQKEIDERRMGNMAMSEFSYADTIATQQQLQIRTKKHLINYELTSKTKNQLIFNNKSISYPNQIIFQKSNDSIQVIYKGNEKKKNSKESKEIQKYVRENKATILTIIGLN